MRRLLLSFSLLIALPAWAADASLTGTLHDKSGRPLPDIQMELQNGEGRIIKKTTSDKDGRYKFMNIIKGSYVLLATENESVLGSTQLTLLNGENIEKDLDLTDNQVMNIVISKTRQDVRNSLSPTTGTNAYKLDAAAIEALPEGTDTSLNKVLLQTPGVAEDSAASGSLHIRGEHANLQYRLNGILLPDGISGFGDTIDSHIIESATLLDGTLPAQYGFRTAAVIDIDTKTGFENGGTATLMGGSQSTIQPSVSYGVTYNDADYFLSASHLSSDLGIENPTSSEEAIHDHTEQNKQFAYASYMINPIGKSRARGRQLNELFSNPQ